MRARLLLSQFRRFLKFGAALSGIVLAALHVAQGQDLVLRTTVTPPSIPIILEAGKSDARVAGIVRTPELLVLLSADALEPVDLEPVQKFMLAALQALRTQVPVRLGIMNGGNVDIAGPFRTAQEIRAALRTARFQTATGRASDPVPFMAEIAAALAPIPSEWGYTLIAGHMGQIPNEGEPDTGKYAIASLTREFLAQKRSLLFWDPSGVPGADWTRTLSLHTGGFVFEQAAGIAQNLLAQETLVGITANLLPPARGFRLESLSTDSIPELAGTPTPVIASAAPTIPTIAQFTELRLLTGRLGAVVLNQNAGTTELTAARADLEKALAINPADWTALSLGISLTERQKDGASEIPLLEEAVELRPDDAVLWRTLGNLQYDQQDFIAAEASLLHAREHGATGARISEQLGRIRYASRDYVRAEPLIDESLSLDSNQQPLWFVAADIARATRNTEKLLRTLERALAPGGIYIEQRAELIRLYLAKGDKPGAARHADIEVSHLPDDAGIQAMWAQFYQELSRPDDALPRWTKAIQIEPKLESAHAAITAILLTRKRFTEVLEAAERGLEYAPDSPRLQLAKGIALEHLDRVYEARHAMDAFAPATEDIGFLTHQAEISDTFGGSAPATYRRLALVLEKSGTPKSGVQPVLERGWKVALREGDSATAGWFAAKLSGKPEAVVPPDTQQARGIWIPGGTEALMFMARGPGGSSPGRFVLDYCRTVLANEPDPKQEAGKLYRKSMDDYFAQLKTLIGMGVRTGDISVITLSIADRKNEKQTETVLDLLGWKIRRNKQKIAVESNEKSSQAEKQDLPAALAIDQGGMQSAFQAGKPFRIEIPWDWVPLVVDGAGLRQFAQSDKLAGGLPEALVNSPDLARFYVGMGKLDRETTTALTSAIGINALATRFSSLLAYYSTALAVSGGRVLVPGGAGAEPVWASLAAVAPSVPVRFLRTLLEKEDGKLLAFFNVLSQLDLAHQRFFTLSAKRAGSFYRLFADSEDVRAGPGKPGRSASFAEFLRGIPLNDDGTVNFPGGPEVWMVAHGGSKKADQTQKMLRKVRRAIAPDIEDEILLRIASTRYIVGGNRFTELDNFLAVAHIDAHRSDPLDEESALLLAQNLAGFGSFYPYFSVFTGLKAADFKTFLSLGTKLTSLDTLDAEQALGQFFSVAELIRLGLEFGSLPEPQATAMFRTLCTRFLAAQGDADFTAASLDFVREMVGAVPGANADRNLAALVLGKIPPVALAWNGTENLLDPGHRREVEFGKVLNLQKTPSLATLLRMDAAVRSIAGQKGPVEPLIAGLLRDAASLPVVEVPKTAKFEGKPKQAVDRYSPAKLPTVIGELRQKAQKKKVNPKDLEKFAREILSEIGPQVRLALTGIIYGAYFSPEDGLAANDPLLLRKHQSFPLQAASVKAAFVQSDLVLGNPKGGSYFVGGFGYFAHAAGREAGLHVRTGGPDEELYARQTVATRMTAWSGYRDEDQRLLGLRIRVAREWLVYAADQPAVLRDLSDDTLGILSLSRRRDLMNAIGSGDWHTVWDSVTLSDLLFLGERYTARYKQSPWNSPVDGALREASARNDGSRLNLLGAVPLSLYGCGHPHLLRLAPYEEYENHYFPVDLAERTAEMKIYVSALMDKLGWPAGAMPAIAEPATRIVFRSIRMSDSHDWVQALAAFRAIDEQTLSAALEAAK